MKYMVIAICSVGFAGVSCMDPGQADPGPDVGSSTQALRNQPGETIEVHGCLPGELMPDHGGLCYNPQENLPPPDWGFPEPDRGPYSGGHGGGGGFGGGMYPDNVVASHEYAPGIISYTFDAGITDTLKKVLCDTVCISLSQVICDAIKAACAVGTVVTLGGVTIECAVLTPYACVGGVAAGVACTAFMCHPEK